MDYIKGFTYGFMAPKGSYKTDMAKESLVTLANEININTVIFAVAALQDTAQSVVIDYKGEHIVDDNELIEMIRYAQSLGLDTILKPMVNVRSGTWRAHICFFDEDVPCEPKWSDWFKEYTEFQCHYAKIARQTNCKMLIVGCEMVQSEKRENEWRNVINEVRKHYDGLISYNTDKYQEDRLTWWDAVDVISSSGYYPIDDWDNQLKRIEKVVKKHCKPFFFAEAGCPSRAGASFIPYDWTKLTSVDLNEQKKYYEVMFDKVAEYPFVKGFGLWEWHNNLYKTDSAKQDDSYGVFGKPAIEVIKQEFS